MPWVCASPTASQSWSAMWSARVSGIAPPAAASALCNMHDVRVLEPRGDFGLAMKTGDELLVRGELAVENLGRDVAIDSLLKRAVDAPHRADAGELTDLDVPRDLATEVGIGRRRHGLVFVGGPRGRQRASVVRTKQGLGRERTAARRTKLWREGGRAFHGHHGTWDSTGGRATRKTPVE
jgi:hypothetical protein